MLPRRWRNLNEEEWAELSAGSGASLYPVSVMELTPLSGLRLRRAVLGTLLDAHRPLTVGEVVDAIRADGFTTRPELAKPMHMVVADMLAYQVRAGRVRRTSRATFVVIRSAIPSTTQWRCRHWRD